MEELKIKNLNVTIDGEHLLKDISISVGKNEVIGILGESGSGKTLTTKFILNILPEKAIVTYDEYVKKVSVGAIFQNAFIVFNPTVRLGRQLKHLYKSHYNTTDGFDAKISEIFKKVGLDKKDFLRKYSFECSGGERQRLAIAGALIGDPSILIADEVTTALDTDTKNEVLSLLNKIRGKTSIIYISHEVNTMRNFVDRIYVMYKGEIIEKNTTKELFENPKQEYTKRLVELANKYID
ncbi:ABC transporter ATP-binding protein, partial [Sneathia sp. DSM 16630]|uniref:ATP-binding cassette domain-containing protein n=1 Tax=Sneathia vaginalis TaxID=187101 RepID=UPI00288C1827|nr:ATP-binding cassette domain-containing protein [Sneathia vaginalis]MBE2989671.1 ABC transporter ATP-binding protein [Sneathia sp. DSM 16630]